MSRKWFLSLKTEYAQQIEFWKLNVAEIFMYCPFPAVVLSNFENSQSSIHNNNQHEKIQFKLVRSF